MRNWLIGVLLTISSVAQAGVGFPPLPGTGFATQDGRWLRGFSGGLNYAYYNGLAAAGSTQASATQLPGGFAMYEIDTVPSGSSPGIALPSALQGTSFTIYNNGLFTIEVYPSIANNSITKIQDTISNQTSVTIDSNTKALFTCAKNGIWAAE
jgi:hypothetical protein